MKFPKVNKRMVLAVILLIALMFAINNRRSGSLTASVDLATSGQDIVLRESAIADAETVTSTVEPKVDAKDLGYEEDKNGLVPIDEAQTVPAYSLTIAVTKRGRPVRGQCFKLGNGSKLYKTGRDGMVTIPVSGARWLLHRARDSLLADSNQRSIRFLFLKMNELISRSWKT